MMFPQVSDSGNIIICSSIGRACEFETTDFVIQPGFEFERVKSASRSKHIHSSST